MGRVWQIDSGDFQAASDARKEFAAYVQQAAEPESDCQAAVLVFGELLANALMHGRGRVKASLATQGSFATLCVEDEGAGFALGGVQAPIRGQPGGRGLQIVTFLARSVQTGNVDGTGFRVTVELPVRLSD